jgi:hypothetical protein
MTALHRTSSRTSVFLVVAIFLGAALVGTIVSLTLRTDGSAKAAPASMAGMRHDTSPGIVPTKSFAGILPENAPELAAKHKPYDASLRPAPKGDVAKVRITIKDKVIQIAPGVKYSTWAFGQRRSRPDHPRPPGPDGRDHAREQGHDPTLG